MPFQKQSAGVWLVGLVAMVSLCVVPLFSQGVADAATGSQIFQKRCAVCHGETGEGVNAVVTYAGPCIQAVHNPGDVMTAVEVGPGHMPSFAKTLTIEQIRAVAKFVTKDLAVIPLKGGNVSEGGELFRMYCATCHRTAARGGAMAYVDINAPDLSHKSAALVAGAVRMGPGPMPAFPPKVINDQQLASIVKYVVFVQHPPNPGGRTLNWHGPVSEGVVGWTVMIGLIAITVWIEKNGKG